VVEDPKPPDPIYETIDKIIEVFIPPETILKKTDLQHLKGCHATSIVKVAKSLCKKYEKKMRNKKLVSRQFVFKESVMTNSKEIEKFAKKEDAIAVTKMYNYHYYLPSTIPHEERQDVLFEPINRIGKKINDCFSKAKRMRKKDQKDYTLIKYVRSFSYKDLMSNPNATDHALLRDAQSRAEKFETQSLKEAEKTKLSLVHKSETKKKDIAFDRKVKKEMQENPELSIYVKPEEPKPIVLQKKRNKISLKKELHKQKKFENQELRKSFVRRKNYIRDKNAKVTTEEQPKEIITPPVLEKEQKEVEPPPQIEETKKVEAPIAEELKENSTFGQKPTKFLSKSIPDLQKKLHNRQMRRRRLDKEAKKARVIQISLNKAKRVNKKKERRNAKKEDSFTTEALTFVDEDGSIKNIDTFCADFKLQEDIGLLDKTKKMLKEDDKYSAILAEWSSRFDKIVDDNDFAVNLLIFLANLSECRTATQISSASWLYLSTLGTSPHIKLAVSATAASAALLLNQLVKWRTAEGFTTEAEIKFDGFSPSRILDTVISWGSRFFTSDVYHSIKKFVLSLVSLGMFERDHSSNIQTWMGKAKKGSILDCAQDLIQSISQLVRSGEMLVRGYSIEECFFSPDPLKSYIARSGQWMMRLPLVVQGVPPEGKIHITTHVREGREILDFLTDASKKLNTLGENYNAALSALTEMQIALPLLCQQMQSRTRPTPLAIVVSGRPGVGKSTVLSMIYSTWAAVNGLEYDPEMVFHRTPSSEYWETYDPTIHRIVHISEIGSKTKTVMQSGDQALAELTSVIDSTPYPVPMAFKDKGKIFCLADLIVIDCNDEDMGIDIIQTNGSAFKRRFFFLRINPKLEYQQEDSYMMDAKKEIPGEHFLDKYAFQALKKKPTKGDKIQECIVFQTSNYRKFCRKLAAYMRDYYNQEMTVQEKLKESLKEIPDIINSNEDDSDDSEDESQFAEWKNEWFMKETTADKTKESGDRIKNKRKPFGPKLSKKLDPLDWVAVMNQTVKDSVDGWAKKYVDDSAVTPKARKRQIRHIMENYPGFMEEYAAHHTLPGSYIKNDVEMEEKEEKSFTTESENLLNPFNDNEDLVNNEESLFPPEMGPKIRSIVKDHFKENKYYAKELCKRSYNLVSNFSNASLPVMYSGVDVIVTGATLWSMKNNSDLIFDPAMWAYFSLIIFTMMFVNFWYCFPLLPLFFLLKAPKGLYDLRTKSKEFAEKYATMRGHWAMLKRHVKDDTTDLMVLPRHIHILGAITLGLGTVGAFKLLFNFSKKHSNFEAETSSEKKEENQLIDDSAGCKTAKVRIRTKQDSWNVIQGDVPLHTSEPGHLYARVMRNVKKVAISVGNNKEKYTHVLGLCGNICLVNTHAIAQQDEFLLKLYQNDVPNCVPLLIPINKSRIMPLENDCSLLMLTGVRFTDITGHIQQFSEVVNANGFYNGVNIIGVKHCKSTLSVKNDNGDIFVHDYWLLRSDHKSGDCGKPFFVLTQGGTALVGIHAAGGDYDNTVVAVTIPKCIHEGIIALKDKADMLPITSESATGLKFKTEISPKSVIKYEDMSSFVTYGSLDMPILANMKSKLKKTPFYPEIDEMIQDEFGYIANEKYGRPHLKSFTNSHGEWISPYNLAIRKINRQRGAIHVATLHKSMDVIVKHLSDKLKEKKVTISPLPLEEAINGALQDYYTRKIDMTKGSGFGRSGKKGSHFDDEPEGKMPKDDLLEGIIDRKKRYLQGLSKPIIFEATPKDEPRAIPKIDAGKTRIFYAGYLESLVLARQYLGPIFSLFSEFNSVFGCAIGSDPHRDGKRLSDYLREVHNSDTYGDELWIEGDYEGYDVSMNTEITWAAFTVLQRLAKLLGYNDHAMKILEGLMCDLMHPLIEMLGDLIMAIITPSGMYGTAELNSIKGLLIVIYLFLRDERSYGIDPFEVLRPLLYGDDLLCAVNQIVFWFNSKYFAEACKRELGMTFTSASKGEHEEEFVNFFTATFLRRTFRKDGDFIRMPLTLDSVEKTIGWMIPSRAASEQDQLVGALQSFMREIFQRTGPEKYEKIREWAENIFEKSYLIKIELPRYFEIKESIDGPVYISESMIVTDAKQSSLTDLYNDAYLDRDTIIELRDKYPLSLRAVGAIMYHEMMGIDVGRLPHILSWPNEYVLFLQERISEMESEMKELETEIPVSAQVLRGLTRSDIVTSRRYGNDRKYRVMCDDYLSYMARYNGLKLSIESLSRAVSRESHFRTESAEGDMTDGSASEMKNENLGDMAGATVTYSNPNMTRYVDVGIGNSLDIHNFMKRPIRIATYENAPGVNLVASINPWTAYLSQPSVRAKLRNTAFLRGTMKVRINVSAMPFHFGRYIYSYIPFAERNKPWNYVLGLTATGVDFAKTVYLSQSPYARTYDVTSNSPTEMTFPYISPLPAMRLFNDSTVVLADSAAFNDAADLGVLYIRSMNTVRATTPTPSDVSIAVYAWMEDVEFGYPTATQLQVTTESDERIVGPISSATKSMSEVANMLSSAPIIGSYAKASGKVLDGLTMASSALGWSYPTLIDDPMRIKNEPYQNAVVTEGMDTGKRLVLDPKQEITVDPSSSGGKEDELVIQTLCKRESLLATFMWNYNYPSLGVPLRVFPISPMLAPSMANGITSGSKEWMVSTPLSMCAIPFKFWRGDIILRFEFVCSMFHRGKLIIGYEPNIRQQVLIDTVLDTNKNYITTVDLQETRHLEIKVNWANALPWLETGDLLTHPVVTATVTDNYFRVANGYVYVTPLTKLQSPDDSDIEVNVYIRSDNMHFNATDVSRLPSQYTAESHLVDCENAMVVLNPSSASEQGISTEYFGEEPLSFRSLLRRFETTLARSITVNNGRVTVIINPTTIPVPVPNYGEIATVSGTQRTLFTFLRYAFLAMRGGMRKRFVLHDSVPVSNSTVFVNLQYTSGFTPPVVASATGMGGCTATGTAVFVPVTNTGVEVEIPWYTCSTWGFAQNADYLPVKSYVSRITTGNYLIQYACGGYNPSATTRPLDFSELTAIAEDFNFSNFIAAYPVVVYTVP
jgi:hypothetical protein